MKIFYVELSSLEQVKGFLTEAVKQEFPIEVTSGSTTADAKSMIGLFSLDLSTPVRVEAYGTAEENEEFVESVQRYVVE
jgi:phosphotransferase system HPr-like phosphotransfer protein